MHSIIQSTIQSTIQSIIQSIIQNGIQLLIQNGIQLIIPKESQKQWKEKESIWSISVNMPDKITQKSRFNYYSDHMSFNICLP